MQSVEELLGRARAAQRRLALAPAETRSAALRALASTLAASTASVLAANAADLAEADGLSAAMRDRLTLTPGRVAAMVTACEALAAAEDPLAEERPLGQRPNGLRVSKRRIPLGTLAVIYEARPNVTVEAAALAIRSGNAIVLRGGREALGSNVALGRVVRAALVAAGLDPDAVVVLEDTDRQRVVELLGATGKVDLVIPRGGPKLMALVDAHARVPVIRHGAGVCHVYLDRAALVARAVAITVNAKAHRPGVCNAAETLLVHRALLPEGLVAVARALVDAGVTLRVDPAAGEALRAAGVPTAPAVDSDWDTEYLDLVMAVRVVDGLDDALAHIAAHGTEHSASIVTEDRDAAERFIASVDASCVLHNASTRFNDGGELGLGAEIGISTSRMHAYGPMGVRELTTEKFVVRGDGQVRS